MSGLDVTIDFSEVNALARRLGVSAAPALLHEMEGAMRRVIYPAQRIAVRRAKKDTGRYRSSITTTVDRAQGAVLGTLGSNAPQAIHIELGRRPGAKMPPPSALIASGWIRRHPQKGGGKKLPDTTRAYLIARAIGRRGIPATHNLRDAFNERLPAIQTEFGQLGPRTIQRLIKGAR